MNLVSSAVHRTLDKSHSSTLNYCFNAVASQGNMLLLDFCTKCRP